MLDRLNASYFAEVAALLFGTLGATHHEVGAHAWKSPNICLGLFLDIVSLVPEVIDICQEVFVLSLQSVKWTVYFTKIILV